MFIIDGAQDEFFPIDSLTGTFDDLRANSDAHRLLVIKDWDHGWYALFTGEEAAEISAGALHYVFRQGFGLHAAYASRAPMPQVDALIPWICLVDGVLPYDCAAVQASFEGESDYAVRSARLNWSADGSLTYQSWNLQEDGGVWRAEIGTLDGNHADELVYWGRLRAAPHAARPEPVGVEPPPHPNGLRPQHPAYRRPAALRRTALGSKRGHRWCLRRRPRAENLSDKLSEFRDIPPKERSNPERGGNREPKGAILVTHKPTFCC